MLLAIASSLRLALRSSECTEDKTLTTELYLYSEVRLYMPIFNILLLTLNFINNSTYTAFNNIIMARQISKMTRFATLIYALTFSCSCETTSIRMSPLGLVPVCPGGQVLLTCERNDSVFHWTVFSRHLDRPREIIVTRQGVLLSSEFRIGFTEFNTTLTSERPLISQLLINNVTTEMNGSIIYCSEDGDETNALMTVINVKYKDDILGSMDCSLNVTMVNQLLRGDDVTVTLQWPREPGAVYHVNVSPETTNTQLANTMIVIMINLTISYDIQYNISIVSSLCGVTTTKVLNYVTCDYPPTQLLRRPVIVASGSQDSHPLTKGQFITYTCPPGFTLTGPNMSVCTGNREWEPDPGQVDCIANDGCRVPMVNRHVKLNFSSTLEGSVLILTCENEKLMSTTNPTDKQTLEVICHSSTTSWNPDPTEFIESCSIVIATTLPGPGATILPETNGPTSAGIILGSVLGALFGIMTVIIIISAILCLIKKGFLNPKSTNRLPDIQLENVYLEQSSPGQPDPVVQQDTLVYADIGPSSLKKRNKQSITPRPDDTDDRVEYALLNHSLQKPTVTTNQDSIADDSLNLNTLLIQVRGAVTPHWYQLGQVLEVSKDVLDRCSNYPPEESIVEVLDQWLRNYSGRPTWRDVANALRKIGLQQLANDIEMVYETGKLPIQVDDDDDAQQVFTTTALELNRPEEDKVTFNNCQDQDELAPPLPPKPLAESDMPIAMSAPPRPPKYTAK